MELAQPSLSLLLQLLSSHWGVFELLGVLVGSRGLDWCLFSLLVRSITRGHLNPLGLLHNLQIQGERMLHQRDTSAML